MESISKKETALPALGSVPIPELFDLDVHFSLPSPTPDTHVHMHTRTITQIPHDVFAQGISPLMAAPISSSSSACVTCPRGPVGIVKGDGNSMPGHCTGAVFVYPPLLLGDKNAAVLLVTYTLQNASPTPPHPLYRLLPSLSELACNLDDPAK